MNKFKISNGFLANSKIEQHTAPKTNVINALPDSGSGNSCSEATQHVLIAGSFGSGKTHNIFNPAIPELPGGGKSVVIMDIKGDMRVNIRQLAKKTQQAEQHHTFG